jgi:hypothetical protein
VVETDDGVCRHGRDLVRDYSIVYPRGWCGDRR